MDALRVLLMTTCCSLQSEVAQKKAKEIARNIMDATARKVAPPQKSLGETFSIEEQNSKKDALKKLLEEQREQLKGLSSVPKAASSGVYPRTSQAPSNIIETGMAGFEESVEDKPSITVGDILSGKVDPESVDTDVVAQRAKRDNTVDDSTAVRKPVRQKLPSAGDDVTQEKRPMRQKLPLVTDSNIPPRPAGSASAATPKGSSDRWQVSEEDRKKANKWGINIDKLL